MLSRSAATDGSTSAAPRPVRPRQVFCPIEAQYRDLEVAEDARVGRFHCAGTTLAIGLPPDWRTGGLADDEEWHIEWSKFYFGLDLAHAYSVTRDGSFLDAWRRLVESWIDQCAPDEDTSDVTARRLQNWLYAWQAFDRTPDFPALDSGFEGRLLASMAAQVDHLSANLTEERNHRTLELFALLVVSLALPELDPRGSRAETAWTALQDNLVTDVWEDGVQRERSTHYHLIALRSFVAARVNVVRFGGVVPAAYDERLRAACRFAMHVHRPDGLIPALSDSDSGSYLDLLELAADCFDDDELRYVAAAGQAGRPPAERAVQFPVAGYHVQRSGWGDRGAPYADERFLVFGCGPLGDGGHGHYDALSVEAYALGHPLVVDPGRYTYAEGSPDWRHWFKGTAAHNTVTVDGLDQQPYRRGKPKGPQLSTRLLARRSVDGVDLLCGDVTSPAYDAVHRRAVLFVAGEYWLVLDSLHADRPHDYALRWHLADDVDPVLEGSGGVGTRLTTDTVALDITGLASGGPMNGVDVSVEPGWVAAEYGVKTPAPVVVATSRESASVTFATLLAGRRDGTAPRLGAADLRTGTFEIEPISTGTITRVDRIRWRADRPDQVDAELASRDGTSW